MSFFIIILPFLFIKMPFLWLTTLSFSWLGETLIHISIFHFREKNKLMKTIEKLQGECNQIRMKYEDLKKSKQDTLKEVTFLHYWHYLLLKKKKSLHFNSNELVPFFLSFFLFILAESDKSWTSRWNWQYEVRFRRWS